MNKQELIERIEGLKNLFGNKVEYIEIDAVIELVSKLDEPETGHADEAPRYVKNILARLRELPLHDREVWLKAIMSEFEQDFSHAKWREGYEQGKFEGAWVGNQLKDADKIRRELNQVKVPQFVADWIENCKRGLSLRQAISQVHVGIEVDDWLMEVDADGAFVNQDAFARAWLDGYEVEKERRYRVRVKGVCGNHETLNREKHSKKWLFSDREENTLYDTKFTRTELEDANFGWVFDCPGIEVEEVE